MTASRSIFALLALTALATAPGNVQAGNAPANPNTPTPSVHALAAQLGAAITAGLQGGPQHHAPQNHPAAPPQPGNHHQPGQPQAGPGAAVHAGPGQQPQHHQQPIVYGQLPPNQHPATPQPHPGAQPQHPPVAAPLGPAAHPAVHYNPPNHPPGGIHPITGQQLKSGHHYIPPHLRQG